VGTNRSLSSSSLGGGGFAHTISSSSPAGVPPADALTERAAGQPQTDRSAVPAAALSPPQRPASPPSDLSSSFLSRSTGGGLPANDALRGGSSTFMSTRWLLMQSELRSARRSSGLLPPDLSALERGAAGERYADFAREAALLSGTTSATRRPT